MKTMQEFVNSAKAAITVAVATVGSGISTIYEILPKDIGTYATAAGIILSVVLSYTHWRRGQVEYAKTMLEMEHMRNVEAERLAEANLRRRAGYPLRRTEDVVRESDQDGEQHY